MCQGIFSSASKVKHPFSTRSEPRHELVALQAEQRDECQTHTGLRGLQQLTSGFGLWPDFWKRPHSSWKQPQLIYCGTIQLPCTFHPMCVCVSVCKFFRRSYTAMSPTGEPLGMSHSINSGPKSLGLMETQKGFWCSFVFSGEYLSNHNDKTDAWVTNSTLTLAWFYFWSHVTRKKTHPVSLVFSNLFVFLCVFFFFTFLISVMGFVGLHVCVARTRTWIFTWNSQQSVFGCVACTGNWADRGLVLIRAVFYDTPLCYCQESVAAQICHFIIQLF